MLSGIAGGICGLDVVSIRGATIRLQLVPKHKCAAALHIPAGIEKRAILIATLR